MTVLVAKQWRLRTFLLAVAAAGALLIALGIVQRASAAEVTIGNNFFQPASVTVPVGEAITWTNTGGSVPHTVTSAQFDSGILNGGQSFTYTPTAAGTISYSCTIHPEMTGTITVTAAGGGDGGGDGTGDGGTGGGGTGGTTAAPKTGTGGLIGGDSDNNWLLIAGGALLVVLSGTAAVVLARPRA